MLRRLPPPPIVIATAGALTLASIAGTLGYLIGRYTSLPYGVPVEFQDGVPSHFIRKSYMSGSRRRR